MWSLALGVVVWLDGVALGASRWWSLLAGILVSAAGLLAVRLYRLAGPRRL